MARSSFRIRSALTVEGRYGAFGGKRWMELLAAVAIDQSISAAARSVGLSYKAAWDAIDAMNNLSEQPLVERAVGGKGGGGTRLTAYGQQLVDTFRAVESENAQFMQRLNARIATAHQDLKVIERFAMVTSARNQLAGKITRIAHGAVNDEVELQLAGGDAIVAVITHESTERMGLAVGEHVIALIKASSVIVATDLAGTLSARNQLRGTVARVATGAVNSEVAIDLAGGNSLAAIITNTSAQSLSLAEGAPVTAIFKASSVILAVSG